MSDSAEKAALIRELANLYADDESVRRLVSFAGIPEAFVKFGNRPIDTWFSAVTEADNRSKRVDLVKVALLEKPGNAALHSALRHALADATGGQNAATMASGIEKLMGAQSTLLPISFLEVGLDRARSVGRISTPGGLGTGFLISDNLVVTNHHVLPSSKSAEDSFISFNFQATSDGSMTEHESLSLRPADGFLTSKEDDLTIVRTMSNSNERWGIIPLVTFDFRQTKRVNIVQHPGGGPKQIALYHNLVSHIDEDIVQYYTDTLPGSSGSPLFDDHWRLVGVHHAGGDVYSPTEKNWVYRNEGISVRKLAKLAADPSLHT